jgi:hypothetical protein
MHAGHWAKHDIASQLNLFNLACLIVEFISRDVKNSETMENTREERGDNASYQWLFDLITQMARFCSSPIAHGEHPLWPFTDKNDALRSLSPRLNP